MKKLIYSFVAVAAMLVAGTYSAKAQAYKTGAGIHVDLGDGGTYVGPQVKHFFSRNNAIQAQVLFGSSLIDIGAEYQYNRSFGGEVPNLQWYAGAGADLAFGTSSGGGTSFGIRPIAGLDFKIPGAPLDLAFDWRPRLEIGDYTHFSAGRFGIGARFTF